MTKKKFFKKKMLFSVLTKNLNWEILTKNLNWEILTKNLVTFKRWNGIKDGKF